MSNGVQPKKSENSFFTVEFFGVTLMITSFLLLVCLLFGNSVLFVIGSEVQAFLLGLLGYLSYPVLACLFYVGLMMLLGKSIVKSNIKSKLIVTVLFLVLVMALLSVITNIQKPESLNEYTSYAFNSGRNGLKGVVAGGVLFALITYPLVDAITFVGSILALSVVILLLLVIVIKKSKNKKETVETKDYPADLSVENATQTQTANNVQQNVNAPQPQYQTAMGGNQQQNSFYAQNQYAQNPYVQQNVAGQYPNGYPQNNFNPNQNPQVIYPNGFQSNGYVNPYDGNRFGSNSYEPTYEELKKREESMRILYGNQQKTYSQEFNDTFVNDRLRVENQQNLFRSGSQNSVSQVSNVSDPISTVKQEPSYRYEENDDIDVSAEEVFETYNDFNDNDVVDYDNDLDNDFSLEEKEPSIFDVVNDETETENNNDDYETFVKPQTEVKKFSPSIMPDLVQESAYKPESEPLKTGNIIENMPINYKYNAPPISIFKTIDNSQNNYENEIFKNDIKGRILTTLKTFGVDTTIANIFRGPAVTRFDIVVPPAMSMAKIVKLADDLNLRIAAKSSIRMVAPVPNTSYIGVEVPNQKADSVSIKDIISSDGFVNTPPSSLYFAFGKDIIGNPVSLNLADMPHVLISGTTGSGKSVCLNSMILSLISKYGPDQLRFVIIDPKQVDFEPFRDLPHMMFNTIIDNNLALCNSVLTWAVEEMERRYAELKYSKSKNIGDYNRKAVQNKQRIMPRIVLIIDEFADLMMRDKKGIGEKICLIAQKSRAAGIHLVLAAQRPSADIVNGPIKANLPARLVFRASSHIDSTVSLGETGAEKLLGKGDCLYKTGGMLNTERAMGAYVSDEELYDVIDYVVQNNVAYYDHNSWTKIKSRVEVDTNEAEIQISNGGSVSSSNVKATGGIDQVYIDALQVGFDFDGVSVSSLQRRLGLGYPRAAKVVDWLLDNGYISAETVKGKRKILISRDEFEEKFLGGAPSNNENDNENDENNL